MFSWITNDKLINASVTVNKCLRKIYKKKEDKSFQTMGWKYQTSSFFNTSLSKSGNTS